MLPKGTQNARISNHIRISEKDLLALQKRAVREGLPCQTLVSSVLHKYVTGALVERWTRKNFRSLENFGSSMLQLYQANPRTRQILGNRQALRGTGQQVFS